MTLLSETEIQFLQGYKITISKSYEYKLKLVIKKKVSNIVVKELQLLLKLFPDLNLTKFSNTSKEVFSEDLAKISKDNYDSSKINKKNNCKDKFCGNYNSPAQIRTGVKGSKGLYACPLHSDNLT